MQDAPTDFQSFLQTELVARCERHPRYSLRAFAKSLAVEPSHLSRLLNGKRAVTAPLIDRLAVPLELSPDQVEQFKIARFSPPARTRSLTPLSLDSFHLIADWYHFAILELTRVQGFRPDPRWIASRLGISVFEARVAMDRLVRLQLLLRLPSGKWQVTENTTPNHAVSDAALRKLQRQVLEMAIRALENTPIECRDQTTMTMAISRSRVKEAKARIQRFRRDLSDFLEAGAAKDAVYQLSVSLFPVTQTHTRRLP